MWCSVCQSDVATEVGADNRRVSCSNCGHLLAGAVGAPPDPTAASVPVASRPDTRAEEARQLLDRWAKGHFFDPYGPPKKTGTPPDVAVAMAPESVQPNGADSAAVLAARPQAAAATPASNGDDNRNIETIDERSFVPIPPHRELAAEPAEVALSGRQTINESADVSSAEEVATEKVVAVNNEPEAVAAMPGPAEPSPGDPGPIESASSAELDRLTREIMARVSKITEERAATDLAATNDQQSAEKSAADQPSSQSPIAASGFAANFPEPGVSAPRNVPRDNEQRATSAQPTAFDEPIPLPSEMNRRLDATHQPARNPEPAPIAASTRQSTPEVSSGGWYNNIGQMLAYLGIICLTAGTCGVIVSYFGGPANYAPYGWLGATIGQMLLFLGIVTLISAGMEQTSQELRQAVDQRMDDVTQRLDQIGTRIMRIEEANLGGPPRPHMLTQPEQERRRTESATSRANGSEI
jgi:hypothetical protein